MENERLDNLVTLSREFGREDRGWAILGEGNTSTLSGKGTYYVKASGSRLGEASREDFTEVNLKKALEYVEQSSLSDEQVIHALESIKIDPMAKLPSVETFVHAVCLSEGNCEWVGHGHPESVLSILCSEMGAKPYMEHIFPDVVVVCGRHFAVVPYVDPGFKLAQAVSDSLSKFKNDHSCAPKIIFLENHGPFILGQSHTDVINTMQMLDKWSKILITNYTLGGPRYLPAHESNRIEERLDEAYRRKRILESSE